MASHKTNNSFFSFSHSFPALPLLLVRFLVLLPSRKQLKMTRPLREIPFCLRSQPG